MNVSFKITLDNKATPMLSELLKEIDAEDQPKLMKLLADDFEILTRDHITKAAATRHKTASKLGASPTGYLEKRSQAVESEPEKQGVLLKLQGDIFKRTFRPVTVTAVKAKMLTIPWRKEAYGRRASEFADLFPVRSKRGQAFLARRKDARTIEFLFLLKKSVTLPQDRGLLPSGAQYAARAEMVAKVFLEDMLKRLAGE